MRQAHKHIAKIPAHGVWRHFVSKSVGVFGFVRKSLVVRDLSLFGLIVTFSFAISACVDVVTDVEYPEVEPKIVIHAFISPSDTAVQVLLSWSNPISGGSSLDSIRYITGADVGIAESGRGYHTLRYHHDKQVYYMPAGEFLVEAGKNYSLRVNVDGHNTVTAQCYVPYANTSLKLEKIEREQTNWSEVVRVEYSFDDVPGLVENFYAPSVYIDAQEAIVGNDTIRTPPQRFSVISGEQYLSNKGREGRHFVQRAEGYNYNFSFDNAQPELPESTEIFMLLLTTDEHYYKYHKALENYFPNNPFAEPVLIYSNVNGGLGVFAGFNKYVVVVEPENVER